VSSRIAASAIPISRSSTATGVSALVLSYRVTRSLVASRTVLRQKADNRTSRGHRLGCCELHALSSMLVAQSEPLRSECPDHRRALRGFAERLRVQWPRAVLLPDGLDVANVGNIKPTAPEWYTYCAQRYRAFKACYFTAYDGRPLFLELSRWNFGLRGPAP